MRSIMKQLTLAAVAVMTLAVVSPAGSRGSGHGQSSRGGSQRSVSRQQAPSGRSFSRPQAASGQSFNRSAPVRERATPAPQTQWRSQAQQPRVTTTRQWSDNNANRGVQQQWRQPSNRTVTAPVARNDAPRLEVRPNQTVSPQRQQALSNYRNVVEQQRQQARDRVDNRRNESATWQGQFNARPQSPAMDRRLDSGVSRNPGPAVASRPVRQEDDSLADYIRKPQSSSHFGRDADKVQAPSDFAKIRALTHIPARRIREAAELPLNSQIERSSDAWKHDDGFRGRGSFRDKDFCAPWEKSWNGHHDKGRFRSDFHGWRRDCADDFRFVSGVVIPTYSYNDCWDTYPRVNHWNTTCDPWRTSWRWDRWCDTDVVRYDPWYSTGIEYYWPAWYWWWLTFDAWRCGGLNWGAAYTW